jgi:isopentenyl-diphosphate delta-isomerase
LASGGSVDSSTQSKADLDTHNTLGLEASRFEARKHDHIAYSLNEKSQSRSWDLDRIELIHEALPEIDLNEVSLCSDFFGQEVKTPFLCSSMTAGNSKGAVINKVLAEACALRGWPMGLGSQRRELFDPSAAAEIRALRRAHPDLILLSNLGLTQAIQTSSKQILTLVENAQAQALIVHTNPLQEALQPEGTPEFRGGLKTLERLASELPVPVVLKEVGCGFSEKTLMRLNSTGVAAVDLAGRGGTHWGRVEGMRGDQSARHARAAKVFQDWGISSVQSLLAVQDKDVSYQLWASGGVRSGLDAAKLLAIGAQRIGVAKPLLQSAIEGLEATLDVMEQFEYELKLALFCVGAARVTQLKELKAYRETYP